MGKIVDLAKLAEPFPAQDIEWRVSRASIGSKGINCRVLAYITARAIQQRLDDVIGPEFWRFEPPEILTINGKSAFSCGLSIKLDDEWITKYDVAEPTAIEPAKGGWSSAAKRAGAVWGIGRYLYHLEEKWAEVSENDPGAKGWNWARLSEKQGGATYYWKTPSLPAWALPKADEGEVTVDDLNSIKKQWRDKFAADVTSRADLVEGFSRFVSSIVGDFPADDVTCWTGEAFDKVENRIHQTTDPSGVSPDVPFEE